MKRAAAEDVGRREGRLHADAAAVPTPRVLAIHWRRGDFLKMHSGVDRVCEDEISGAKLPACTNEPVLKGPKELAAVAKAAMAEHNCTVVFLATNAKEAELKELTWL
eukprot:5879355-Prymnesium_polylepis.1